MEPIISDSRYNFNDHSLISTRLQGENPLLLHPEEEDFDPFDYFKFTNDGYMLPAAHKGNLKFMRAKATIDEIVRLNRDKLYLVRRKRDLRNYEKRLLSMYLLYLKNYLNNGVNVALENLKATFFEVLTEIHAKADPKHEYSFFWSYVYKNFFNLLSQKLVSQTNGRILFLKLIKDFKSERDDR